MRSLVRTYSPSDVRDANIVHQLRSGDLLTQIAPLLGEPRDATSSAAVASAIADRRSRLHARALAMLHASTEAGHYLHEQGRHTMHG